MTNQDLNYFLYDVFTEDTFGGGPLSVVEVPKSAENVITDELMQKIAREFNYPETVFIFEPDSSEFLAKLRIFTISKELPLAGHPTIGASIHLKTTRKIDSDEFILDLKAGATKIIFEDDRAFMFQQPHQSRSVEGLNIETLCDAIGLKTSDLNPDFPIEFSSTGLEFLMIPIKDIETLSKSVPNIHVGSKLLEPFGTHHVYLFTGEDEYYVRMYDLSGTDLIEDPGTGSAAGSFTMYLNKYDENIINKNLVIHQGMWMDRPSVLYTSIVTRQDGQLVPKVGGKAFNLGEGTLHIPL